jgi:hypothetical protein
VREVICANRDTAEAEANRQQASETADATWIYSQVNGQWIARRTSNDSPSRRKSRRERAADVVWALIVGSDSIDNA